MEQHARLFLKSFVRDESGTVLPIVGLSCLLLILVTGFTVDYTRGQMVKDRLQWSLDTAALAAGREVAKGASLTNARAVGQDYFDANFPKGYMGSSNVSIQLQSIPSPQGYADGIRATASSVNVESYIMDAVGMGDIKVNALAEVNSAPLDDVEIVFALDISGSMRWPDNTGSSCLDMSDNCANLPINRGAGSRMGKAKEAMRVLVDAMDNGKSRFSVVPWNPRVNIGNALRGYGGNVCVAGTGAPNAGNATPGCSLQPNGVAGTHPSILHMSSNYNQIRNYVDALPSGGNTDSSNGMLWALRQFENHHFGGWRGWNHGGNNISQAQNKIIIIMSDGANTRAYTMPCGEPGDCPNEVYAHNGGAVGIESNRVMEYWCNYAKAAPFNAQIFSIVYNYPPAALRQPYRRCATNPQTHYFEADNGAQLTAAIQKISRQLTSLRLTR